jgi:prepilin-type N-terminal cleavage/methylation domain-containing protein
MGKSTSHRGFTLIELVLTLGIVTVLAAVLLPTLGRARNSGRDAKCLSNLRQIGIGLKAFQVQNERYPAGGVRSALRRYMPSQADNVYLCPFDEEPELGDSYSDFYCPRWERDPETGLYVVGCPRHGNGVRPMTVVLHTLGEASVKAQEPTRWNSQPILPGVTAVGGVLRFADGSTSALLGAHRVVFLTSFDIGNGRSYSVLKVEDGVEGTVDNSVTPGSKFEVVTPAAVAGVKGTEFDVTTYTQGPALIQYTRVAVDAGSVRVTGLDGSVETTPAGRQTVKEGSSIGAVADSPSRASEGIVYIRGAWYFCEVKNQGSKSAEIEYSEWDPDASERGRKIGKEKFRRDIDSADADAGWYKIQDSFAPND